MSEIKIQLQKTFSEELSEAFTSLMPQLSPRLGGLSEEKIRGLINSPHTFLLTAENGEEIVGMLTLTWYDVPSGRKGWIEDVVVDEKQRGHGIGHQLLQEAFRLAAADGIDKIMLTSSPHRHAAHALYHKEGFQEVDTTLFRLNNSNRK